jgi:hypothetical protein
MSHLTYTDCAELPELSLALDDARMVIHELLGTADMLAGAPGEHNPRFLARNEAARAFLAALDSGALDNARAPARQFEEIVGPATQCVAPALRAA